MADIFRISVVLAIVYLARFILALEHQTEDEQFHSDSFVEDSNEEISILQDPQNRRQMLQISWSDGDIILESDEEILFLPDNSFVNSDTSWYVEHIIVESDENILSGEEVSIDSGVNHTDLFEEEESVKSSDSILPNKNMIKSEDPHRDRTAKFKKNLEMKPKENNPLKENIMPDFDSQRTVQHTTRSRDQNIEESFPGNHFYEDVLIQSGVPLDERTALFDEKRVLESKQDNPSNERILIYSGAPLRGRTIHQTAWSKEEKILESKEDTKKENAEKSSYDAWSLTKAFNYLLSFIYDVNEVRANAGNTKQTLKPQIAISPDIVLPQSQKSIAKQNTRYGKISKLNRDEDSFKRSTTSSSPSVNLKDQHAKSFKSNDFKTTTMKSVVITEHANSKLNKSYFQSSVKSPRKANKENGVGYLQPETNALSDLYPDYDVQENVGSYNYMLDSFEFIRVDEKGRKVNQKQNYSNSNSGKNEIHSASEKMKPILSKATTPVKDKDKPENFETILEYLYKHSNSTLLLSLKEQNSSELKIS